MSIEERLAELGINLPQAPKPVAAYVSVVRSGNLLYISGQLPLLDGELVHKGKLGRELSLEQGCEAARAAALNCLAIIKQELGSLDKVKRIVKVFGVVACDPTFYDQPKVINGASELLVEVFGDKGRHARLAAGVCSLPLDSPVEVEMIVEF